MEYSTLSSLVLKFIDDEVDLRTKNIDQEMIQTVLRYGAFVGSSIEHHSRISRGGDLARQHIREAEEGGRAFHSGLVILADEMEQSKGRFDRTWHAPAGGIWITLVLVNTMLPEHSLLLPMAAGLACCETIRHYGIDARIKWVNDTLAANRKISGILSETFTGSRSGEEYILIGAGINVNNDRFPEELAETATSMKSCLGGTLDLADVTARLLVKLRWNIGLLLFEEARFLDKYGGISGTAEAHDPPENEEHLLLKSYKGLSDMFGRQVLFGFDVQKNPQFEARVTGLDRSGGIILEMADASEIIQHSGEIIYLD